RELIEAIDRKTKAINALNPTPHVYVPTWEERIARDGTSEDKRLLAEYQKLAPRCREWVSAYDFILREARGARR
ncbi:MAG TPA: hypothetical protein VFK06_09935, partial [Candidatus Angelobacter sp.]|nr:hypothetical protein [Candidatus Angelobacter sp.]